MWEVNVMKKIKVFLTMLFMVTMLGGMTASASEVKGATDLTAPIDIERQTFTGIENSILVPATEEEQRASSFPHTFQGTILADGVRLRSTPSESATVLELMYSGERVWIDEGYQNADWYHVTRQSTGRTGYVYWEYLQPDFQR